MEGMGEGDEGITGEKKEDFGAGGGEMERKGE